MDQRQAFFSTSWPSFDVAIVGGGIQGACLYHRLSCEGYRVLLIDRGDFASATSQASAMLVWGGLLYLRRGEIFEVRRLCRSRDRLLRDLPQLIRPHRLRYVFGNRLHRPRWIVRSALWLYWLIGGCRRRRPRREARFGEQAFLASASAEDSFTFEEAQLDTSDANFVLSWIFSREDRHSEAMNYCAVEDGRYDPAGRLWHLNLRDAIADGETVVSARWVVNAAGVWTDGINDRFGIESPCKHALSRGVSITIPWHPLHRDTLVFDAGGKAEGMSLVPWGPVSLWGSTEVLVPMPENAFRASEEEVAFLLQQLNRHLAEPIERSGIVSLRCGVRPLAVPRSFKAGDPLDLSRRGRVVVDPHLPWISLYGGKITGCTVMAEKAFRALRRGLGRATFREGRSARQGPADPPMENFGPLTQPVPSPDWCRRYTQCCTLEDYLRRRTNIAQWVPRGGFGREDEYTDELLRFSMVFAGGDEFAAANMLAAYRRRVTREMSPLVRGPAAQREAVAV